MNQTVAAEQMYQFYKTNKATLPPNISSQRTFIIDALCQGEEIASIFAAATKQAEAASNQSWGNPKKRKK